MLVFLVILCFAVLAMYASIHPRGLVIFSQDNLVKTGTPTSITAGHASFNRTGVRGPAGVTRAPDDPWWVRLRETERPRVVEPGDEPPDVDWLSRVRVKVASETLTTPLPTPPPSSPMTLKTTPSTKRTTTTQPKSPRVVPQDYDDSTIVYNYKSINNPIIRNKA